MAHMLVDPHEYPAPIQTYEESNWAYARRIWQNARCANCELTERSMVESDSKGEKAQLEVLCLPQHKHKIRNPKDFTPCYLFKPDAQFPAILKALEAKKAKKAKNR